MTTATILGVFPALLAMGVLGTPRDPASAGELDPAVYLRVFVHAAVASPTLELAREAATDLLQSGGIRVEWRHCNTHDPTCGGTDGRGVINVRLVPTKITSGHVCGHTTPGSGSDTTILVYLPCVMSLAESLHLGSAARSHPALATLQAGHLIGLTMAHEVGHALGLRHAGAGVMKARLEITDLVAMRSSRLMFKAREVTQMRLAMLGRQTQAVAQAADDTDTVGRR